MEGTASGGYDAAEANTGDNKFQDYGHSHWHNSLIWGEDLHNIGIVGPGLIYGKGLSRGAGHALRGKRPESAIRQSPSKTAETSC